MVPRTNSSMMYDVEDFSQKNHSSSVAVSMRKVSLAPVPMSGFTMTG